MNTEEQLKRIRQLAGIEQKHVGGTTKILEEAVDLSEDDPLHLMTKYMKELQLELKGAQEEGEDSEIINQIEQDIHEVSDMIERKKQRMKDKK